MELVPCLVEGSLVGKEEGSAGGLRGVREGSREHLGWGARAKRMAQARKNGRKRRPKIRNEIESYNKQKISADEVNNKI